MFSYIVFAGLLCTALAQLHSTCHTNAQELKEEEVVALVADIVDRNQDNVITTAEVVIGFGDILGYQFSMAESLMLSFSTQQLLALAAQVGILIDREHFVQKWTERFGDSAAFARATFDAYDENKDGQLSALELEHILKHVYHVSDNGDGILTAREFREYLLYVYKAC
ncbi:uncharacterized protein LOC112563162 [Pomacea canaliculata]|uniref:uncharacterized protein LOC112563162 n=1 Tax=Pomacea canaliculata TaxID=400727 RepID=UPI000D73C871|nr:uncharacterized protein LOC112563162 [Pomacea canaliculata]